LELRDEEAIGGISTVDPKLMEKSKQRTIEYWIALDIIFLIIMPSKEK